MTDSFSTTRHLLLISPNWLGDVVMALPAFQQWRALIGPHVEGTPQVEHLHSVLVGF